jgi:hypothetical protein
VQVGLNFEGTKVYNMKVDVVGELSKTVAVTINLLDVNEPPVPASSSATVAESLAVGGIVINSIPSNDPDAGAVVVYSIDDGNADGYFAINSASGRITVAKALDFEAMPATRKFVTLLVRVSDGADDFVVRAEHSGELACGHCDQQPACCGVRPRRRQCGVLYHGWQHRRHLPFRRAILHRWSPRSCVCGGCPRWLELRGAVADVLVHVDGSRD